MRTSIAGLILFLFCLGCGNPRITATWKTDPIFRERYFRILVIAVLPEGDSVLRRSIEMEAARSLSSYGYYAISAVSTFGARGLAAGSQEDTYLKLCNNGIDAVMTFALVPENENLYAGTSQYLHPSSYYYNRMWNYKKMQTGLNYSRTETNYFWETIVFDLVTLQAIGMIRTRSFSDYQHNKINNELTNLVLQRMVKEKIIQKKKTHLKAF